MPETPSPRGDVPPISLKGCRADGTADAVVTADAVKNRQWRTTGREVLPAAIAGSNPSTTVRRAPPLTGRVVIQSDPTGNRGEAMSLSGMGM